MLFSLDNLVRQERGLYTFATKYLKPEDRDSPEVCVRHKDYSSEEAKDFSMCWIDIEETMRLAESFLDVNFLTKRPTKISDVFRIIQAVYSRFNKDYLGVQGQNNGTPLDMLRKFERGEQVEGDCKDFVPVTQYILAAASVEHRDATGIINVFRDSVPHTWLEIGVQKEKTQLWVPYDYHWIPYVTQNWSAYSYLLQEELPHTQERVTCKIKLWE